MRLNLLCTWFWLQWLGIDGCEYNQFLKSFIQIWPNEAIVIVLGNEVLENDQELQCLSHMLTIKTDLQQAAFVEKDEVNLKKRLDEYDSSMLMLFVGPLNVSALLNTYHSKIWLLPCCLDLGLYLRLDSKVFVYEKLSKEVVKIHEAYGIRGTYRKVNQNIGHWDANSGITWTSAHVWERRANLSDLTLSAVHLPWERFTFIENDPENGEILSSEGFLPDLFKELQTLMRFKYTERLPPDGSWGNQRDDGSWNGMVGMLERKEVDICIAALSTTVERSRVLQYGRGIYNDYLTLNMKKSYGREIDFFAFVNVFNPQIWLCIVASIVSLAVGFKVITSFKMDTFHKKGDPEAFGFLNGCSVVFVSMLQREYMVYCNCKASKMLYVLTCITSFMLFSFYSAVLTTLMTANPPPSKILSFGDVLSNDLQMLVLTTVADYGILKNAKEGSALHKIYHKTMKGNDDALLDSIDKIEAALESDPLKIYFGLKTAIFGHPNIISLDIEDALTDQFTFGFQKDSEFTQIFNYYIQLLEEYGVMYKLKKRWKLDPDDYTYGNKLLDATELDIFNVVFPFLGLACGVGTSLVFVLCEKSRILLSTLQKH